MCDCNNKDTNTLVSGSTVPDFTVTGFVPQQLQQGSLQNVSADVLALDLKVCVKASIQNGQICFDLPYFGRQCVSIPAGIPIPDLGSLKACAATCGSFVPTGAKVTIYYNDMALFSYSIGFC